MDLNLFLCDQLHLQRHPHRCGNPHQKLQGRIVAAALKPGNIASRYPCPTGKLCLGHTLHFPATHILLDHRLPGIFLLHLYQDFIWFLLSRRSFHQSGKSFHSGRLSPTHSAPGDVKSLPQQKYNNNMRILTTKTT